MIASIDNHLWQSTAFVLAAALLTFVLRRNRARVRYWVWLTASVKFLIPFSLLIGLGSLLPVKTPPARRIVTFTAVQIAEPFSQPPAPLAPTRHSRDWLPIALAAVWACGFLFMATLRIRGWLRVRAAVRAAIPAGSVSNVEIRSTPQLLEPGVVGLFRPILLLPEGIAERLTPSQLEAVLAHELSHVRRRDNLAGAVHMLVEAIFWFHPLVWWIGARLVEERVACDEAVLDLGNQPRDYADAILGVVKLYVESPIVCVAGVTGSNLKKRIEAIMNTRTVFGLNFAKKATFALAGVTAIAAPVWIGVMSVRPMIAQQPPAPQPPTPTVQAVPPSPSVSAPAAPAVTTSHSLEAATAVSEDQVQSYGTSFILYQRRPLPAFQIAPSDAAANYPSDSPAMRAIRVLYGAPDQIEQRDNGTKPPSQIWRYNYLPDFHDRAEFEFTGPKAGFRINWPPPLATFEGTPAVAQNLADELNRGPATPPVAGLLGAHAEIQTYPSGVPQRLVVPFVPSAGQYDIAAEIDSVDGARVEGVRDHIVLSRPGDGTALSRYDVRFILAPGAYICNVALRDAPAGQIYTETINFEVK